MCIRDSGKIAGVSINKSASGVGGATRVVMRGAKSIEGDNNALYVAVSYTHLNGIAMHFRKRKHGNPTKKRQKEDKK